MYARKGEIFTPKEVAELMSKLILTNLEKQFNEKTISVFDVACGAGNLLTVFYEKSISRFDKTNTQIELFGQDIKGFLLALAEMNFILHGVEKDNFHLFKGDSLIEPFDRKVNFVMTNPPWNLRLQHIDNEIKKNKKLREEIYKYGIPSKSADWLWLQLINYLIKEKAVVILDNGVLFRGGSEEKVRKAFVEDDSIEAIIQLPEKIFFNTQSGAVLIVLNKKKPIERKGKILFIDASKEFEKHPDIRRLNRLKNEGISKILKVYRDYLEIEDFSVIVDREQIAKNFFNLNPSIYFVDQRKENPPTPMEINELLDELERLNKEYNEKFEEIKQYLKEAKKVL
jgi:type I restriction enzyme M protein